MYDINSDHQTNGDCKISGSNIFWVILHLIAVVPLLENIERLFVQQFSIAGQISKQTALICPAIENCCTKRLLKFSKRGTIDLIDAYLFF